MKTTLIISLMGALAAHAAALPESQKIDALLSQEWQKNKLAPNAPATDDVIVRRLYLDIAGRIPSLQESQSFLDSKDPQKRQKLIDELLASDGYTSNMFNYWADVLRLTDNVKGKVTAQAYEEWVKSQIKANTPYDEFVRKMLTTEGGAWDSGAIGFYQRDDNKLDHLAYTVQVFLGTSIVCAQCHNHPFDKWTQMDYYGMAAFTYGMDNKGVAVESVRPGGGGVAMKGLSKEERKKRIAEREAQEKTQGVSRADLQEVRYALKDVMKPLRYVLVRWNDNELPKLPHDYKYADAKPNQVVQPKVIFGHDAVPQHGQTRLAAFADWMASPENPRFSTVIANRMWKKAFGAGLIEPVDEMTDSTVASNTELMDYLAQLMVEQKYSLKSFLRVLYNTDAYQRVASKDEVPLGETYHFTGPMLRRMGAEQIWDSLVMLSKGNVDNETSEENKRMHQYLGDLKMLTDTIHEKGPVGLVEAAKHGSEQRDENMKKVEALRLKAKESGDKEVLKEAANEANKLRRDASNDMLTAILGEDRARELKKGYYGGGGGGKGKGALSPEVKAQLAALSKEERRQAITLGSSVNLTHRASEIGSPARPGHLLRTFGQSDRELIQNANDDATVPQALAMLNGPVCDALNNPISKLRQDLAKAEDVNHKMDMLYLSFLSRKPTAQERQILDGVVSERGDHAIADVTHALLTGSQFLFIQ